MPGYTVRMEILFIGHVVLVLAIFENSAIRYRLYSLTSLTIHTISYRWTLHVACQRFWGVLVGPGRAVEDFPSNYECTQGR